MFEIEIAVCSIVSVFDIIVALFFIFSKKKEETTTVIIDLFAALFLINAFLIWL